MRRSTIALLVTLPMMGCSSPSPSGLPNDATTWQKIQAGAVQACRFEPTFNTVANLIALGVPYLGTITSVVAAICDAVKPVAPTTEMRTGAPPPPPPVPTIQGVKIEGRRV